MKGTTPVQAVGVVAHGTGGVAHLSVVVVAHGAVGVLDCTVPKYRAAVDYTPRLRASQNLPRCMANSDTCGQ